MTFSLLWITCSVYNLNLAAVMEMLEAKKRLECVLQFYRGDPDSVKKPIGKSLEEGTLKGCVCVFESFAYA